MSILFVMFLSINVAFAADNNDKNKTATTEKAATEVVVETTTEKTEPEGIRCKVENETMRLSCWFCNCAALADQLN